MRRANPGRSSAALRNSLLSASAASSRCNKTVPSRNRPSGRSGWSAARRRIPSRPGRGHCRGSVPGPACARARRTSDPRRGYSSRICFASSSSPRTIRRPRAMMRAGALDARRTSMASRCGSGQGGSRAVALRRPRGGAAPPHRHAQPQSAPPAPRRRRARGRTAAAAFRSGAGCRPTAVPLLHLAQAGRTRGLSGLGGARRTEQRLRRGNSRRCSGSRTRPGGGAARSCSGYLAAARLSGAVAAWGWRSNCTSPCM